MTNQQNKWSPKDGQYRAAGKGPLGVHYGKPVYNLEAVEDRKKSLAEYCHEVWVEHYAENQWAKLI